MSEPEEVVKISGEAMPIRLMTTLRYSNPRATDIRIKIYSGLTAKQYRKKYLIAEYRTVKDRDYTVEKTDEDHVKLDVISTAMEKEILKLYYRTGSHKHADVEITVFFIVVKGDREASIVYRDETIVFSLTNLQLLGKTLTRAQLAEVEAELINRGWLPSEYEPVRTLYFYWVKLGIASGVSNVTKVVSLDGDDRVGSFFKDFKDAIAA